MTKEVSQGAASGNEVPVVARRRRHTRSDKLRILAEADMLVNQYEDGITDRKRNEALYHRLYRTEAGKRMFEELYFEEYKPENK